MHCLWCVREIPELCVFCSNQCEAEWLFAIRQRVTVEDCIWMQQELEKTQAVEIGR